MVWVEITLDLDFLPMAVSFMYSSNLILFLIIFYFFNLSFFPARIYIFCRLDFPEDLRI
jgi:hypothetical protein